MKLFCGILLFIFTFQFGQAVDHKITVYSTFRDSRGLIWMGSDLGIMLYQGDQLISYQHSYDDSLTILNGIIYAIAEDENKNIWAMTYANGISIFNPLTNEYSTISSQTHPELFSEKYSINLQYLGNHTMLLNTSKGAYFIDTKSLNFKPALSKSFMNKVVLIHKKMNDDDFYLLQNSGLLKVNRKGEEKLFALPKHQMNFMGLNVVNQRLFVSGFSGIFILNHDSLQNIPIQFNSQEISNEGINDILFDEHHNLYFNSLKYGMLKGILKNNQFYCYKVGDENWYSPGNSIYSNYYDSISKCFYVGTQQGLKIINNKSNYFSELLGKEFQIGTVRSLLKTKEGLYIGTEGGAFLFNNKPQRLNENNLDKKIVLTQLFKLDSRHVFGAGFQFYELNNHIVSNNVPFKKVISKGENSVISNVLNDSTIFIISNADKKIIFWNRYTNNFTCDSLASSGGYIAPAVSHKNSILLSSFTGIFLYDLKSKSIRKITNQFDTQITDIKIYNDDIYYSSSTEGIIILDSNFKIKKHILVNKLVGSNNVQSITLLRNNLWFSSSDGIGYCDLKNNTIKFFKSGGLFTTSGFMNADVAISGDTLFYGGYNGVVSVNTKAILEQKHNPSIYIADVSIYKDGAHKKVINPLNHTFKYNENNLELQLIHSNTDFAESEAYDYILNNNTRIPIDQDGKIKLYNLTPSKYVLKIVNRITNQEVAQYLFTISPPWYQSNLFKILLALLILANGIWITQLYYKRKLIAQQKEIEKQLALQSERDRIAIDMHDDLGSGLSSIKLISEMLKKKHNDPASQEDLNSIVEHATELTSTMREMVWSLNPRNDTVDRFLNFIQQYSRQFFEPSEIKLSMQTPSILDSTEMNGFIRRNVFLCYKEILNNCIKHSKATHIQIECHFENNILSISVVDDGIGLNEVHKPNNGFYNMKKRIHDCNGSIEWNNRNPGFSISMQIPIQYTYSTNV